MFPKIRILAPPELLRKLKNWIQDYQFILLNNYYQENKTGDQEQLSIGVCFLGGL